MAKHQKVKTTKGGRNGDRSNGKAWGKNHVSTGKHLGHNETGRTKPSGHSIGGHAITKIREANPEPKRFDARVNEIKSARDTQRRKAMRQARMSDKKSVKTSK